jgi:hypothetical protein
LVEETGVPRENHWPSIRYWQTLSHNIASESKYETSLTVYTKTCCQLSQD